MLRAKSFSLVLLGSLWALNGCGSGGSGGSSPLSDGNGTVIGGGDTSLTKGYLIDSPVVGVTYECGSIVGITTSTGEFECSEAPVTFKIGGYVLGSISAFTPDSKVYPQDLLGLPRTDFENQKLIDLTRLLQSLDDDGNIDESISIPQDIASLFDASSNSLTIFELAQLAGVELVSPESAIEHLRTQLESQDTTPPVVTVPANISVVGTSESGIAATHEAIAAFLTGASATDNTEVIGAVNNDAPAVFPVGVTTVIFTAVDAEGNTGTASATVTVTAPLVDNNSTGTCVTLPRLGTGDVYTIRTVNLENDTTVDVETTIEQFSETSGKFTTVVTGDVQSTGVKDETWSIGNNYIDITKIVTKDVSTVQGFTVSSDITLDFSPYQRTPIDTVCDGDVHTTEFGLMTTGTVAGFPTPTLQTQNEWITTIESVNETKVIGLGTFTAVKMNLERRTTSNNTTTVDRVIRWIDTATGYDIAGEYQDDSGNVVSTQELIYHN